MHPTHDTITPPLPTHPPNRLLYRSDRNYDEAIKCYKNALRQDKENLQILRDLAQLQVQMRDMAGFVETRYSLLQLKPANRAHWIAFAVAHHLEKNYEVAVQVLDAYANTLESVPPEEVYGYSEMLLYKATVLQEAGMYDRALEHLAKSEVRLRGGRLFWVCFGFCCLGFVVWVSVGFCLGLWGLFGYGIVLFCLLLFLLCFLMIDC